MAPTLILYQDFPAVTNGDMQKRGADFGLQRDLNMLKAGSLSVSLAVRA